MKIGDIVIGQEYAMDAEWKHARRRLRAEEIVKVPVTTRTGDRFYRTAKVTLRRLVRCTVLDWETGEATGPEVTYEARTMEPYAEVMDRIRAQEARKADHEDRKRRVVKALDYLGVPAGVTTSHGGVVVVSLDGNGIDALEHHALTD